MTKRHGMALIYPAARWENAFPSGNGSLAALVFGNICEDTIILNHEALWLRRPRVDPPDVSESLPDSEKC